MIVPIFSAVRAGLGDASAPCGLNVDGCGVEYAPGTSPWRRTYARSTHVDVGVSPEPEFGGGNYTIRFVPQHFRGLVAAHCHLFVHVEPGMIMYAPVE